MFNSESSQFASLHYPTLFAYFKRSYPLSLVFAHERAGILWADDKIERADFTSSPYQPDCIAGAVKSAPIAPAANEMITETTSLKKSATRIEGWSIIAP